VSLLTQTLLLPYRVHWNTKIMRTNIVILFNGIMNSQQSLSASKVQWPELSQLSLCSEFDKENSMEFSLISLLLIHFTTVAMRLLSHGPHVTLVMWHPVTWPSVPQLWHCDKVTWYFPMLHFVVVSSRKEKKRKRNINNDLAVLPSHDNHTWRQYCWTCENITSNS